MKNSTEEIHKLRSKAEVSLNKTAQLQKALAQLEANLSRQENQKITEKSKQTCNSCIKKFQTYNSYLRMLKTTYKWI